MKKRVPAHRCGLPWASVCSFLSFGALAYEMAVPTPAAAETTCSVDALTALNIPDLTISDAISVPAVSGVPSYCRVVGSVRTAGEGASVSSSKFQSDLPSFWNGKFLFIGGQGLDGDLLLQDGTPDELAKGYATGSTNSGHVDSNGTFAITDPGVPNRPALIDYDYRSRHQVTVASKSLVRAFYNARKISYSYFNGCSHGGEQGLMEASRYPDDYDGIISGAPWSDPLGTELWSLKNIRALVKDYIPYSLFPQINAAIVSQCDEVDGVKDGLIQNPARCAFNPDTLVPTVLTQKQSDAIKTIIAPVTDTSGNLIYPGSPVSDLFNIFALTSISNDEIATPAPFPTAAQPWGAPPLAPSASWPINWLLAYNIINYLALYEPDNDLNSNAFERNGVISTATRKYLYSNFRDDLADDPALISRFAMSGRKLIMYHGYSDPIISPYRTVLLYEAMAGLAGGYDQLRSNARLFMVPDMGHCLTGSGPDVFGQYDTPLPANYPDDSQHDVLTALEEWVENDSAPDSIIATHYAGDASMTGAIDRTMPLCPFPAEARYSGQGDVNDAASWTCRRNAALLKTGPNGEQAGVFGPADQPPFPMDVIR